MGWLNDQTTLIVVSAGTGFSGFFMYSPSPGKGNLIASISPNAGIDPYGNAYPAGSNFGVWNAAGALVQHFGINPNGTIFLADNTGTDRFIGQSSDGALLEYDATGPNPGSLIAAMSGVADSDSNGNSFAASFTGDVTAFHPASGGATAETWQVVGTATPFENSFSAGGTAPRYQKEGIGGGRVRLSGAVNTGAVNVASTPMFNLPAGYRPARQFGFATPNNITAAVLGESIVTVTTGGDVQCTPASTAGKFLLLDGICFELD